MKLKEPKFNDLYIISSINKKIFDSVESFIITSVSDYIWECVWEQGTIRNFKMMDSVKNYIVNHEIKRTKVY